MPFFVDELAKSRIYVEEDGQEYIYFAIRDNSQSKATQQKMEATIARNQIIIDQSGSISFALHKKNVELVRYIHEKSEGMLPIVGVGGIMSPADAKEMIDAGASLVEIYTGFIYEGPGLIKKILKHLEA